MIHLIEIEHKYKNVKNGKMKTIFEKKALSCMRSYFDCYWIWRIFSNHSALISSMCIYHSLL